MADVVLFGVLVPGIENHSLAILGQALDDAGISHRQIPFTGFAGIAEMISQASNARIVGISLQTSEAALAVLAFAQLLRASGYRGTIVVGGHFATLAPEAVLACNAVDVVVELAGERALVGLARGEDPRNLPGVITRAGRGLPGEPVRPQAMRRGRLDEHLGFGAADLIISRGCQASCGYCCVATVSNAAETLGAPRHLRREIESIADEIGDVASSGGRAVHFMDDNILPLDPDEALAWARTLQTELARRRAPRIAFSLQLRADVVRQDVADALVDLGLVRAYVGIDGYSVGQLRAIGRHASASAGPRALAILSERGVLCVANALLVGPTIRFETLAREIDGLATVRHAPVHLLPIEARPGTVYHRRAANRGLIEGGPLWPMYRFEDERSYLVGEVLARLPTRLVERSVPIALYDLGWALGAARRLAPTADVSDALATYASVTAAWNGDQIRVLRAAAEAAQRGKHATEELIAREQPVVRAFDTTLLRASDDALVAVERAVSAIARRTVRAHARGRLLGSVAFAMSIAACSPGERQSFDAMPDVHAFYDAAVCAADPARTERPEGFPLVDDCACNTPRVDVEVTFDARGIVTSITGIGMPLPDDVEQCLLGLVAKYCYPSMAGMTATIPTCHLWIA